MSYYGYGYEEEYKLLKIEFEYKQDGKRYRCVVRLDDNPVVTSKNVGAWVSYLKKMIQESANPETMKTAAFMEIEQAEEAKRMNEARLQAQWERQREREKYRKNLRRTPSLGYIPDGLTVDYAKEYGYYINSAIQFNPKDNDDFLYQVRSLERMVTKCVQRCLDQGRPDAAYAQATEVLRSLPKWMRREELANYFNQYKPRLRKLVMTICQSMIESVIRWNNMEKLIEAHAMIEGLQSEFLSWGLKPEKMLEHCSAVTITGEPIHIERKPNKEELYEMERAKRRKAEEERRRAEEEAEKHSLIPLNMFLEQTVFNRRNVDWECMTIGRMISTVGSEVRGYLNRGQTHDALLLFLQIVKSMCRHFVSDEHYNMFDDLYDPEYSCMSIIDDLDTAFGQGKFSQSDLDFFHEAWKEIEQMEACTSYGLANFKFKFNLSPGPGPSDR